MIVTAGSADKCEACLEIGADAAINYKEQDFVDEVKRLTDGRGADVVLDMVAGDYVAREVKCLADDGRIVIIAVQGGVKSEFNAGEVLRRGSRSPARRCARAPRRSRRRLPRRCASKVWPLLEAGTRQADRPQGVRRRPRPPQAHALMESSAHVGKIMLRW